MENKLETVRRLISSETIENIQTIKKEIIEVPKDEWEIIVDFVEGIIDSDDDPESYYSKGISTDFNGDLCWIDFNSLIEYLEDRQIDLNSEDEDKDEDEEHEYNKNKDIIPFLTKYKDCTY